METILYANAGSVRVTAQDCWLLLATAVPGSPALPSVTIALPLQFAAQLHHTLGVALAEYAGGAAGVAPAPVAALPFTPEVLEGVDAAAGVIETARRPCETMALYGAQILQWRDEGLSVRKIAARLHVSASTIWDFLRYQRVRSYQGRGSQLDVRAHEIWDMRRRQWGYARIAQACGVSKSTVYQWLLMHPAPFVVASGIDARESGD